MVISDAFCYFVNFQVACGYCGAVSTVGVPVPAGSRAPEPRLPDHWRVLDGVPVCDQHEINIVSRPQPGELASK